MPGRFCVERIYGVQPNAGSFGFAVDIRDHSATPSFQPRKQVKPRVCTANFGPVAKLFV